MILIRGYDGRSLESSGMYMYMEDLCCRSWRVNQVEQQVIVCTAFIHIQHLKSALYTHYCALNALFNQIYYLYQHRHHHQYHRLVLPSFFLFSFIWCVITSIISYIIACIIVSCIIVSLSHCLIVSLYHCLIVSYHCIIACTSVPLRVQLLVSWLICIIGLQ